MLHLKAPVWWAARTSPFIHPGRRKGWGKLLEFKVKLKMCWSSKVFLRLACQLLRFSTLRECAQFSVWCSLLRLSAHATCDYSSKRAQSCQCSCADLSVTVLCHCCCDIATDTAHTALGKPSRVCTACTLLHSFDWFLLMFKNKNCVNANLLFSKTSPFPKPRKQDAAVALWFESQSINVNDW